MTSGVSSSAHVDHSALQRRTLNVLRLAVVPGQAAVAGAVAVVTLLAGDLLGSDRLAGMGGAALTVGAAVTSVPLAAVMRRRGRRPGLTLALALASLGSLIAAGGGQFRWFPLFLLGMLLFGSGQAAILQVRYVAADLAHPSDRARAIGAIVWIGTLGAVFGPAITPLQQNTAESLGLARLVGPFLYGSVLFGLGAAAFWFLLRPDPLVVIGGTDPEAPRARPVQTLRRSVDEIRRSPLALLGIAAMAGSQAAMTGVMTMTPPHMRDHGHADLSALVIAVHILGMFGLSPLVGRFVDRVGSVRAVSIGAAVLGTGTALAVVVGYVPVLMFVGLFLLGLGWNLGLIAGTSLLTGSVQEHARVEAQGTGDLTLGMMGAVAAFGSGFVKEAAGFPVLVSLATGLALVLLAASVATARMSSVSAAV